MDEDVSSVACRRGWNDHVWRGRSPWRTRVYRRTRKRRWRLLEQVIFKCPIPRIVGESGVRRTIPHLLNVLRILSLVHAEERISLAFASRVRRPYTFLSH